MQNVCSTTPALEEKITRAQKNSNAGAGCDGPADFGCAVPERAVDDGGTVGGSCSGRFDFGTSSQGHRSVAWPTGRSTDCRVTSVISNWTGRPVLSWVPTPRSRTREPEQMFSALRRTKSEARSLLSIARLKRARSRGEPDISRRTRIDHTCLGNSGRFWPTISPLFQGRRTRIELSMAAPPPSRPLLRSRERTTIA